MSSPARPASSALVRRSSLCCLCGYLTIVAADAVTVRTRRSGRIESLRSAFALLRPRERLRLASAPGSIEAALYDLHAGRTWELNPQLAPEATASIVKVDILETLLHRIRVARQSPSKQHLIQQMIEVSP